MRTKKVEEIIRPYKEGIQPQPSVTMSDKIIHAIELMVNNNLKSIAVVRNKRPIGMVHLEDAFQKLGLKTPRKNS
jgi:signal-transduction protein with cAMP-binding, CBS, and nucleotidyltransferase domain